MALTPAFSKQHFDQLKVEIIVKYLQTHNQSKQTVIKASVIKQPICLWHLAGIDVGMLCICEIWQTGGNQRLQALRRSIWQSDI